MVIGILVYNIANYTVHCNGEYMIVFEFDKKSKCPLCGTSKNGKATLIPIDDTQRSKFTFEAHQVHLDCIDLRWGKHVDGSTILYQLPGKVYENNI